MGEKIMTGFPTREQALRDFFAVWKVSEGRELVPLREAYGRVLAEDVFARVSLPVYRSSSCDGIAVKSADFITGVPDTSIWVPGHDYVRADTGDDFPDEFDAVIMIEKAAIQPNGSVLLDEDVEVHPGSGVNSQGSTVQEGALVLEAGHIVSASDLAALCMSGTTMVPVKRKPIVAFVPTGNELISSGETPTRGQMIESNSFMIEAMLREYGAQPLIFPIVRDDAKSLADALEKALRAADVVVVNGGTALGSEDFNVNLIKERGSVVHHYIAAAPGRPLMMAVLDGKPVIGLPGPTIGAFYGATWCLQAVVKRFLDIPIHRNCTVTAETVNPYHSHPAMEMLGRWTVTETANGFEAYNHSFKDGEMLGCLTSNAYRISPLGEQDVPIGTEIDLEVPGGAETIRSVK